MAPLYFNGKFYDARLNGVHRVADRLIRACDAALAQLPAAERPRAQLLLPPNARWRPELSVIETRTAPGATGARWEQWTLTRAAMDGVLVSLANLAPLAHPRKITMIHDAQYLRADGGYRLRQRLGYRWLLPLVARTSLRTLTVSEYSRQTLELCGVAPRGRTEVVPNGADHILDLPADATLVARGRLRPRGYVVLFGSAKGYKNNRVVFEAFANRALDPLRLVVIGCDRLALEAAGLPVPEGALILGRTTDGEIRGLLESALCLAFPSRTEGFGLPPLEAMLCGCPVVAAPAGAIPEVCGDAVLYAGVDAPADWARAIERLAHDDILRAAKARAGRAHARQFGWARAGERLMAVLRPALDARQRTRFPETLPATPPAQPQPLP